MDGEIGNNPGSSEEAEIIGGTILWPKDVEPLDESLWSDLRPEDTDFWSPADDIFLKNQGMEYAERGLESIETPGSPLSSIRVKMLQGEPLSEVEEARVQRTNRRFVELFEAIAAERILQERYLQSLQNEKRIVMELEEQERNGNLSPSEKLRLEKLRRHIVAGTDFLEAQRQITNNKEMRFRELESQWK